MLKLYNPKTGRKGFFRCWPQGNQWRLYGETGDPGDGTRLSESLPTRAAIEVRLEDIIRRFEYAGFVVSGSPFEEVRLYSHNT